MTSKELGFAILPTGYALKRLGPREVGTKYFNGYWRKIYTVESIEWIEDELWEITCRDEMGTRYRHSTAWDYKRDRVVD
jgi:hypothetical protein